MKTIRRAIAAVTPARAALAVLHEHRRLLGQRTEELILKLANPKQSRFVPPANDAKAFFQSLDASNVEYVVLRWFEDLPNLDRKHDLDLLIADDSMAAAEAALCHWPNGHPVDLYSVSGAHEGSKHPHASSSDVPAPMFPAHVARGILDRRRRYKDLCFVPSERDHFCALAYHVTYIKGEASGLPESDGPVEDLPGASHDYADVLRLLGQRAGLAVPPTVTRAWLDSTLTGLGWRPDQAAG